jgi:hypothetical protein
MEVDESVVHNLEPVRDVFLEQVVQLCLVDFLFLFSCVETSIGILDFSHQVLDSIKGGVNLPCFKFILRVVAVSFADVS